MKSGLFSPSSLKLHHTSTWQCIMYIPWEFPLRMHRPKLVMKNDPYQQTPHSLVFQLEGLVCKYHKPRQLKKKTAKHVTFFVSCCPWGFCRKHVLKLVEWFSGHCRATKSQNLPRSTLLLTKKKKQQKKNTQIKALFPQGSEVEVFEECRVKDTEFSDFVCFS